MEVLRTPSAAFEGLYGWEWGEPSYFTSKLFGEVRIAYWDLQPATTTATTTTTTTATESPKPHSEVFLLTHGEPAWSYLNRRMIRPLLEQGYRVVLFDQVGFGWSDKPAAQSDYSYERHVAWNEDLLFSHLDLRGITAVFQDWGGLLGLRVAARNPDRFDRLVLSNTALPTCDPRYEGHGYISEGFFAWKSFVHSGGLLAPGGIGKLFGRAARGPSCGPDHKLSAAEEAAYQAPFPDGSYCAGVMAFPELVPTPPSDKTGRPQMLGGLENREAWTVFEAWSKPVLLAFSENDPVLGGCGSIWLEKCPGTRGQSHCTLLGAGHFSQDGGGKQLVQAVIEFIQHNPKEGTSKL
ncbi:unnamed protein product [Polarella glacialis]|uniref:AB hydrolase-1 domain-containing protein n=1 Tax=Polarella glacialis TaxID=89957 RepID=A0A813H6K6_POLGL|nr:unnamed protein product [Polarella glacialis]